jgi:beta-aspartyl-peptidase (threonine type)
LPDQSIIYVNYLSFYIILLMDKYVFPLLLQALATCTNTMPRQDANDSADPMTLGMHGGAGAIRKENMTPEKEKAYRAGLNEALDSGDAVLTRGCKTQDAAYTVMTKSARVILTGMGAEKFAEEQGLEIADPSYFFYSLRYKQWQKLQQHDIDRDAHLRDPYIKDRMFGTAGAVALDQFGNTAAGTSIGGMTNKKYGKVGDAPIGVRIYADNRACGVSATSWGEYFIRLAAAHDIWAMMRYANVSLEVAADGVIMKKVPRLGGDGGIVALDRHGNISMTFNTDGMYCGYTKKKGEGKTFIYQKED